jgi:membrane fusion protein (multidrug efflux system)
MAIEAESSRHLRRVTALGARSLPVVLIAGFEEGEGRELRRLLEGDCEVETAPALREAQRVLASHDVAVLCLGGLLSPDEAQDLVGQAPGVADGSTFVLLTSVGPSPERFQDLIDEDRIFYLSQGKLPLPDLSDLIRSALERRRTLSRRNDQDEGGATASAPTRKRQALQVARRIAAQPSLASAGELLRIAAEETVAADRVHCLLYDPHQELLWARDTGIEAEDRQESAAVGLVSFVARTGRAVRLERFAEDPRYEREADDPAGTQGERFLAVPVLAPDSATATVLAVITAIRDAGRAPFSEDDQEALELLASTVAPSVAQLEQEASLERESRLWDRELRERSSDLFREEALEHHLGSMSREGDWLRLSPRWMNATFWLLVGLIVAFLIYSVLGTVDEYASGPAVVRLAGRTEVTATLPGAVASVEVKPGERVAAGQPLVRFQSAREAAEMERIEHDWERQLLERLRDPLAPAPAQALIALQAEREQARDRLEEQVVRAPRAGIVGDVRCRPEQHVQAGDILLSLGNAAALPSLVALLPGQHRPLLKKGMRLKLELRGYDQGPQHLRISSVNEEVVGPEEARRLLGPEIAAAVPLNGPVVLVQAPFPSSTFEVSGHRYELHDGMWGTVDVRVRSEPVLFALVPGLRSVLERDHD